MRCPSVISRFGTLADKQRFDAASAMGQTRSWGHVGSMSGLLESGQGRTIYGRYGDARLTAAWFCDKRTCHQTAVAGKFDCRER